MTRRKIFSAVGFLVSSFAAGGPASADIIGGIDFGAAGTLTQLGSGTSASTYANVAGNLASAYGLISVVNGDSTYCADGTANCALYYVINRAVSATPGGGTSLYYNGTQFNLYYAPTAAINLLGQDSAANLAYITGLTPWATLRGENGVDPTAAGLTSDTRSVLGLTGASISAGGSGLLSVNMTDVFGLPTVEAFLNSNTVPTFTGSFADIAFTESQNNLVINPFDTASTLADSCRTGAPTIGDWCFAGSLDERGRTVQGIPPTTLPTSPTAPAASANIVGGIDFGAAGTLTQLGSGTSASTYANVAGNLASAYGLISVVNGDSTYCADGTANCALYYVINRAVSATPGGGTSLYYNGTQFNLYYAPTAAINLLGQDSAANLAYITGLTPWATLRGENGVDPTAAGLTSDTRSVLGLTGASISAGGSGLLSVNMTDVFGLPTVEAFLNSNTVPTFTGSFADIAFTESQNNLVINPFDTASTLADSCRTGAPTIGDWCFAGSLDERGRTIFTGVPTPGSLALVVLGLIGLGMFRRIALESRIDLTFPARKWCGVSPRVSPSARTSTPATG